MPPPIDNPPDPDGQAPLLQQQRQREVEALGTSGLAAVAVAGGGAANLSARRNTIMTERAASTIPIDKFDSAKDDFDDWIERFEASVALATNAQTTARKNELYLSWLTLWLDEPARGVLKQIPAGTVYETANNVKGVKDRLKELLVDPNDVYKWRALKKKITWDGKECFQSLASRVIRAVDKYEKELDQTARNSSYFFRFREALPKVYQDTIDVSIGKNEQTIDNAKEMATRVKMTRSDNEVSFDCAAMSESSVADSRIRGLELQMSELGTKLDSLSVKVGSEGKGRSRDPGQSRSGSGYRSGSSERYRRDSRDRDRYGGRRDSRDRNRYGDRYDRGYRRDDDRDFRWDSSSDNRRWEERRDWDRRDDCEDYDHDGRDDRDDRDDRSSRDNRGDHDSGRSKSGDGGRNNGNRNEWDNGGNRNWGDSGNRGNSRNRDSYRAVKTDNESREGDIESAVLGACADIVKRRPKQSGRLGKK